MREWLHPGVEIEERAWRPEPLTPAAREWTYLPVRRIPAYVEASIRHGLQWVVFEPDAEPSWDQARAQVDEFLQTLWRAGRLVGTKPEQAFFVRCDRTTMTQDDIDNGRLVVLVGLATVRPAEFVIIRIGMWTADVDPETPRDPDDD